MDDLLNLSGKLHIVVKDSTGKTKVDVIVPNLIVTVGKTFAASRMSSASTTVMTHMAIGSGTTAAVVGNTTLETELARVALTVSGGTPSGGSISYAASFGAGVGTGTITEAGILNASSGGTLLARAVFTAIPKGAGDTIDIVWTVTAG